MAGQEEEGISRLRCLDDVEENCRERRVRRWGTKAVDRNEWQRILEETSRTLDMIVLCILLC
jgi:hypothetical protein